MKHLIDGDLASNNGGWQWAASTGCDAQPYFRILIQLPKASALIQMVSLSVNIYQSWKKYLRNTFTSHMTT